MESTISYLSACNETDGISRRAFIQGLTLLVAAGQSATAATPQGAAISSGVDLPVELRSASALLALLRERKLGALELLDLQLERIERLNPGINAVVAMDVERARNDARAADNVPSARQAPLHGLSMTIKDTFEVTGMPATCGIPELAQHRPQRDADAVARLRAAGAILFGKTNVPTGAGDHQSYNPIYGTTNNPWNHDRTPGGSSGGAAAAVAAGFTPLELGSDIGGSIRCPAHFCGVYGHKSSYGIVPLRGHIPPLPSVAQPPPPLGVAGPIARSARDLELALDILAAPGMTEQTAWSVRVPPSRHESLRDFRVGLWADQKGYSVDSRCLEAMHAFAQDLRKAGARVDDDARPDIDVTASDDVYVAMLFSTIFSGMPEAVLAQMEQNARTLTGGARSYPTRAARAARLTHRDFLVLQEAQLRLCHAWRQFFERFDVMLCPIMPTVAFPHDHSGVEPGSQYSRTTLVDGRPIPYLNGLQWPGLVTVANLPATAIPTGRFIDGLPMGLQVVGPYLEDRTSLRFAQLAEQALGGYVPPKLAQVPPQLSERPATVAP